MWPFEALPEVLQYIGCMLPLAYPTTAFRNILLKNMTVVNQSVCFAFMNLTIWVTLQLTFCLWCFRDEENTKKDKQA